MPPPISSSVDFPASLAASGLQRGFPLAWRRLPSRPCQGRRRGVTHNAPPLPIPAPSRPWGPWAAAGESCSARAHSTFRAESDVQQRAGRSAEALTRCPVPAAAWSHRRLPPSPCASCRCSTAGYRRHAEATLRGHRKPIDRLWRNQRVCLGRRARLPQQHRQHNDQQDMPPARHAACKTCRLFFALQLLPQAGCSLCLRQGLSIGVAAPGGLAPDPPARVPAGPSRIIRLSAGRFPLPSRGIPWPFRPSRPRRPGRSRYSAWRRSPAPPG